MTHSTKKTYHLMRPSEQADTILPLPAATVTPTAHTPVGHGRTPTQRGRRFLGRVSNPPPSRPRSLCSAERPALPGGWTPPPTSSRTALVAPIPPAKPSAASTLASIHREVSPPARVPPRPRAPAAKPSVSTPPIALEPPPNAGAAKRRGRGRRRAKLTSHRRGADPACTVARILPPAARLTEVARRVGIDRADELGSNEKENIGPRARRPLDLMRHPEMIR